MLGVIIVPKKILLFLSMAYGCSYLFSQAIHIQRNHKQLSIHERVLSWPTFIKNQCDFDKNLFCLVIIMYDVPPPQTHIFFFFQKMSHSSTVLFATRATYRQDKMFSSYPQRNGPLGVHVKNKLEKKMSHQLTTFVLSQQSNHVMHETVNSSGEKKRQVLITTCGKLF